MPIGNDSTFSYFDDALWSVLKQTSTTYGANLDNWRKEITGNTDFPGKNYETGNIPPIQEVGQQDTPALMVINNGDLEPGAVQPSDREAIYTRSVVGAIQDSTNEVEGDRKVKKFAELVFEVIVEAAATNFNTYLDESVRVPRQVNVGSIAFPDLAEEFGISSVFVFVLPVTFVLGLTPR